MAEKETVQTLIDELTRALSAEQLFAITRQDRPPAVVLPIEDYHKFQAEYEEKLQELKVELKSILHLVQSHTQRQSLEEVEARLAFLRQKIEQEIE